MNMSNKKEETMKEKTIKEERLEIVFRMIDDNIDLLPDILAYVGMKLSAFKAKCEKENNALMVNALGSACQLLAMKRKPADMKKHCILIEKAQFPRGIEDWHHEGERNFYNKFLKIKEIKEKINANK
jgi:hypothetical protein